jgi:regulatory protein
MEDNPHHRAARLVIKRVSRKECSSQELLGYLIKKGFEESLAHEVIREMIEKKWIDDRRFAEAMSRYHGTRGKGPIYIQNKLREKGLHMSATEIETIISASQGRSEMERAIEILHRRYPDFATDFKTKQKAMQALVRRGFSFDLAQKAVRQKQETND